MIAFKWKIFNIKCETPNKRGKNRRGLLIPLINQRPKLICKRLSYLCLARVEQAAAGLQGQACARIQAFLLTEIICDDKMWNIY